MADPSPNPISAWLLWTLATSFGMLAGLAMTDGDPVFAPTLRHFRYSGDALFHFGQWSLSALVLGGAQGIALRRLAMPMWPWWVLTIVGAGAGVFALALLHEHLPRVEYPWWSVRNIAIQAPVVALAQWAWLRTICPRAWLWLLISPMTWVVGVASYCLWSRTGAYSMLQAAEARAVYFALSVVAATFGTGVLNGLPFAFLVSQDTGRSHSL